MILSNLDLSELVRIPSFSEYSFLRIFLCCFSSFVSSRLLNQDLAGTLIRLIEDMIQPDLKVSKLINFVYFNNSNSTWLVQLIPTWYVLN
jgi:hypothetical protein